MTMKRNLESSRHEMNTEVSDQITKADFFGVVMNRESMKKNKLEHILLAERFKKLVHVIKNKYCSYTKSKNKSSLAERYEKFNMAAFLVLNDEDHGICIKKVISDTQKEQYTEIKRNELRQLLTFEETLAAISVDFNEEKQSEITIDIITKSIKNAWLAYLKSVSFFCDPDDKKTQMHLQNIKNRLETP